MGIRDRLADWIRGPASPTTGKASGSVIGGNAKAGKLGDDWRDHGILHQTGLPRLFRTEEHRVLGTYAERSVAVYSCVKARSDNLRTIPLRFWKQDGRIKRPVESGKLVSLWKKVNPFWSGVRFMDAIEQALCYYGNAYFLVDKSQKGDPELWWIHPGKIKPIRGANYIEGYLFEDFETGRRIPFRTSEIVHIPYFFVENEWEGLSPITAARNGIEAAIDAMRANRKFFQNGMHLAGIVSPKEEGENFTKEQVKELELDLRERFNGADQAHKLAVLSGSVDIKPWGVVPKDAEFMNLAQWTLADVCRVYSVPLAIVQGVEGPAYKNIGTDMKALWTLCLQPEGRFIAAELTEKLVSLFPDEADFCEFDFSGVPELQADRTESVLQMRTLYDMQVPLNALLREYMPHMIPEGTDGFPWGDEPRQLPGITGLGGGVTPDNAERWKDPEARKTILANWHSETVPVDPAWKNTAKGRAYLKRLEPPDPDDDGSPMAPLQKVLALLKDAEEDIPAYGSDEHREIMDDMEAATKPLESLALAGIQEFFAEQAGDMLSRLGRQSLPTKTATKQADDEEGNEEWLLLALLLLTASYPGDDWDSWEAKLSEKLRPILTGAAKLGVEMASRELGIPVNPVAMGNLNGWVNTRRDFAADAISDTTWDVVQKSVAEGLKNGEALDDIQKRVKTVMATRMGESAMIAETEVLTAFNEGVLQAYEASGVVKKVGWLTRMDNKVRDAHRRLHGQIRAIGEKFEIPSGRFKGYKTRVPGQFGVLALDARERCRLWPIKAETPKSSNGHSPIAIQGVAN